MSRSSPTGLPSGVGPAGEADADGPSAPDYHAGMLPATDRLLERSISFSIGALDPNMAPFGLRMSDGDDFAWAQAERFRSVATRILA